MKNVILKVDGNSPLYGRVFPGDELLSINGHPVADVLDYKYYSYDGLLLMEFLRPGKRPLLLRLRKPEGLDPGLEFESYLMDAPRSCANRCVFCFIDQNPPGMRKSIYFKDDDARLSFLMGCYITLTNLSRREVQRIIDLHISPINISVHATEPDLRCRMLGHPRAGELMGLMGRFAAAGIRMNCQIVCCPGWNDGEALARTMGDLRNFFPAVRSVSVVPVGLTGHREGLPRLRPFRPEEAAATVDQVTAFGDRCLETLGTRLVFCSDEFYLLADRPLPPDPFYEEHIQLENGVGMLRLLETEFRLALETAEMPSDRLPFAIATGTAAAPMLEYLLALAKKRFPELDGRVYTIYNDFYGRSVTVAGLLTGQDLIAQLRDRALGARLLISQEMLRRDEVDFLDGVTLAETSAALGVPVYPIPSDGAALCDAMLGILPEIPKPKQGAEQTEYNKYR